MPAAKVRAYYEQSSAEWDAIKNRIDGRGPDARILLNRDSAA